MRISDWSSDVCSSDLPCRHRRGDRSAILTDPHDRSANDNFLAVLRCRTIANRLAETNLRHLIEPDRHAFARGYHGSSQLPHVSDARFWTACPPFATPDSKSGVEGKSWYGRVD